jgi:hypothetical protein
MLLSARTKNRIAQSLLLLLAWLVTETAVVAGDTAYVIADTLNERLCPRIDCPSTNKIYRGQKLEIFERVDGWARVSEYYDSARERVEFPEINTATVARWVAEQYLSPSPPPPVGQPAFDEQLNDPRIQGIPSVGEYALKKQDVLLLRKYSLQLIMSGECRGIEYGDKSVNKPNQYYVVCVGEDRSRFFTPSDVR